MKRTQTAEFCREIAKGLLLNQSEKIRSSEAITDRIREYMLGEGGTQIDLKKKFYDIEFTVDKG